MSTIIKIIKEKTNIPIDSNNINRASMKEIRVDRKNLNMGNPINCVHFSRNQVSWGQNGVNLKKLRQSILMSQNKRTALLCGYRCGGTPGVRTLDPLIKSQMLCQLS